MPNIELRPSPAFNTWRKMTMGAWGAPQDPTIYGMMELDTTAIQAYLVRRSEETGLKLTLTHAVARALALSLADHPFANVMVRYSRLYQRTTVDVFLQVAVVDGEKPADLSGAKIVSADTKSVVELADELKKKANQIRREGDPEFRKTKSSLGLIPSVLVRPMMRFLGFLQYTFNWDMSLFGLPRDPFGSAMVTSVGMFGITTGLAPLFPPSRCPVLLLIGAVEDRPVVRNGEVVIRPMVTLTGTFDHRVVDGYHGGLLAKSLRGYLEHPTDAF